jgi:cell division protein ZapA
VDADPPKRRVPVTILGEHLTLLASGDPREVEELAASVDELMHNIAQRSPGADSKRVAVLACFHLADRLKTLENDLSALRERVGQKSGKLAGLLAQALEERPDSHD